MPSGLLPAVEIDGRLVTESATIMALLEEAFPDHTPLLPPPGSAGRARADALLRLERRMYSDWLSWLCSAWCALAAHAHQPVAGGTAHACMPDSDAGGDAGTQSAARNLAVATMQFKFLGGTQQSTRSWLCCRVPYHFAC